MSRRRGRRSNAHRATTVAVLIPVASIDGPLIVGINRFGDNSDWGLPAGHVDEGEEPLMAAGRELVEETSIFIHPDFLRPFLTTKTPEGYHTTYVITTDTAPVEWPNVLRSVPYEGDVALVRPARLLLPTARHHAHNRNLLRKANLL